MGWRLMINYANYFGGSTFFLHLEWGGISPKLVGQTKMHQPSPPLTFDRSIISRLTSRNSRCGNTSNILEIKAGNKIVKNLVAIEETFNGHFTDIAQVLAEGTPAAEVNPEFYLKGPVHEIVSYANSEY